MKDLIKLFLSLTTTFIVLLQFDSFRITNIYFFDGIYLLIVSSVINYFIFRKKIKNFFVVLIAVFSMNFGFFVLFPVSYERSVSVSLLNNLSEENKDLFLCDAIHQTLKGNIYQADLINDFLVNNSIFLK